MHKRKIERGEGRAHMCIMTSENIITEWVHFFHQGSNLGNQAWDKCPCPLSISPVFSSMFLQDSETQIYPPHQSSKLLFLDNIFCHPLSRRVGVALSSDWRIPKGSCFLSGALCLQALKPCVSSPRLGKALARGRRSLEVVPFSTLDY